MKINLNQYEIETAIKNYLKNYISMPGYEFQVEMNATRGAAGFTAEITITKAAEQSAVSLGKVTQINESAQPVKVDTETGEVETPKRQSLFSSLK